MSHWQILIDGPAGSPFDGYRFPLDMQFSGEYPFKPPVVKFTCRVHHPNVDENGNICIGILKQEAWKPSIHIVEGTLFHS